MYKRKITEKITTLRDNYDINTENGKSIIPWDASVVHIEALQLSESSDKHPVTPILNFSKEDLEILNYNC